MATSEMTQASRVRTSCTKPRISPVTAPMATSTRTPISNPVIWRGSRSGPNEPCGPAVLRTSGAESGLNGRGLGLAHDAVNEAREHRYGVSPHARHVRTAFDGRIGVGKAELARLAQADPGVGHGPHLARQRNLAEPGRARWQRLVRQPRNQRGGHGKVRRRIGEAIAARNI